MASWMLSELFEAGGPDVNVSVKGGVGGVFQVRLNGELVFDKQTEDNTTPHLGRAKEIKARVKTMLAELEPAGAPAD